MTTALAAIPAASVVRGDESPSGLTFSREQRQLIRDTLANGASEQEFEALMLLASARQLNPLLRECFFVKRWDNDKKRFVWQLQVSIDGFRSIADRTGRYDGQDEIEFEHGPEGQLVAAKARVWRGGSSRPFVAVAYYDEFVQRTKDGGVTRMWKTMPHVMLGKCFDDATEVLTDQGFQRFSEVTGRVLEVTATGLLPSDAVPFSQNYTGPMVTLDSDDLNFCVTPNHDMVTTVGKIEAGVMYEAARSRPQHWIPRLVKGSGEGIEMSDEQIVLAAAYLCDGFDRTASSFQVSVRKLRKIEALRATTLATAENTRAATEAVTAVRRIVPSGDQQAFTFRFADIEPLCEPGKTVDRATILRMSRAQARLFVDSLVFFDGHTQKKSGVRRFYTSREAHRGAFEVACVVAGYAVSGWRARESDIGTKPNFYATVSARDEIPVVRWGRAYRGDKGGREQHNGLRMTTNSSGLVWCVTVPSGVIVVRRNGFSMLCGNCAEAQALRKAFPQSLSGLYTPDEMAQAHSDEPMRIAPVPVDRPSPRPGRPAHDADGVVLVEPEPSMLESHRARQAEELTGQILAAASWVDLANVVGRAVIARDVRDLSSEGLRHVGEAITLTAERLLESCKEPDLERILEVVRKAKGGGLLTALMQKRISDAKATAKLRLVGVAPAPKAPADPEREAIQTENKPQVEGAT